MNVDRDEEMAREYLAGEWDDWDDPGAERLAKVISQARREGELAMRERAATVVGKKLRKIPEPGGGTYVNERDQGARMELKWTALDIRALSPETPEAKP